MKPCKSKCSKCGSKDIQGVFIKGGTRMYMNTASRYKFEPDKYTEISGDYKVIIVEYIALRCRFCQYDWKADVLK